MFLWKLIYHLHYRRAQELCLAVSVTQGIYMVKKNKPLVFSPENYISCSTVLVEQNKQSRIERGSSSRHILHSMLYINVMNRLEVVTDLLPIYLFIFAIAFCKAS